MRNTKTVGATTGPKQDTPWNLDFQRTTAAENRCKRRCGWLSIDPSSHHH